MAEQGTKTFESRAKLMLSGEYSVLKGALALALPLVYGQQLKIKETAGEPVIYWQSRIGEILWFSAKFSLPEFEVKETNLPAIGEKLGKMLKMAKLLNPKFLESLKSYFVTSKMDFDPEWGIGSSSSLISNIAYWAECDPYEINRRIFNGSGYDIACARADAPLLYELRDGKGVAKEVDFYPEFHHQLYFIYLNRKQNTLESLHSNSLHKITLNYTEAISAISLHMLNATNLETFQSLMGQHETLTGKLIGQIPVQKKRFQDFNGAIKSLGAWGGDFVLAATSSTEKYVRDYFAEKNLHTVFTYSEMAFKKDKNLPKAAISQPILWQQATV